jgi:signal transduction histidine kinase/CheY-like chemotaxis protein
MVESEVLMYQHDELSIYQADYHERLFSKILYLILPISTAIGLIWLIFHEDNFNYFRISLLIFFLIAIPFCIFLAYQINKFLSKYVILILYYLFFILLITWLDSYFTIFIFIIPLILTELIFGFLYSSVLSFLITIILVYGNFFIDLSVKNIIVSLFIIWLVQALVWCVLQCTREVLQWSQESVSTMRELLESARDQRLQFRQTQNDLMQANKELARISNRLDSMQRAAEEARRAKEEFVANVSHELRIPLNMIIGFGEMLAQAPQTYGQDIPAALLADLMIILRNSRHLYRLIDDILDLSQIEAGRWALTKERVAPSELLLSVCETMRPLFDRKGLYLNLEIPCDLPDILCDAGRIREVLINLLSNAARFTDEGGVHVRTWREEEHLITQVEDTGPGIAPEDQTRLFKPFEQLDPSLRRRQGGTGLGLSISQALVQLHAGKIWMESEIGCGTSVFFTLPIEPVGVSDPGIARWFSPYLQHEPRRTQVPHLTVTPRFVVLERGTSLQHLLGRYMDDTEIVPVDSLDQAMKELTHIPSEALLINAGDKELSDIDHAMPLPNNTSAIICSLPSVHDVTEALGILDYLIKPISRQSLLKAIEHIEVRSNTVLIVDDEPDALRLLHRMLASSPKRYRVLRANNGLRALEIMRDEHPDVVVLDLMMPNMDGFQLLDIKRSDGAIRDIPTIVTSARDPMGQPIISRRISLISSEGLSVSQILMGIKALSSIGAPLGRQGPPRFPEGPID